MQTRKMQAGNHWKVFQLPQYWQTHSVNDLIACIKDSMTGSDVRHAAYLALIATGTLRHLQQLAPEMDFTYQDSRGNALAYAAVLGRTEVMLWLKNDIAAFRSVSAEDQARIIFLLVNHFMIESLTVIARPEAEGGFGWSLEVYDENGKSPAMIAAQHGANYFLDTLVTKRERGGFGLPLDQAVLDEMNRNNTLSLQSDGDIQYHRKTLDRKLSFIEFQGEQYYPFTFFSVGAFAIARLFAARRDCTDLLMVKQLNPALGRPTSNAEVCHCMAQANNEVQFMQQAYPDQLPHGVTHYLDQNEGYNFRAITRAVQGETLDKLLVASASVDEVAVLILAAIVELNRLHEANIIIGNAEAENILMEKLKGEQYGLPAYRARLANFYQASRAGRIVDVHSVNEGYAPELMNQKQSVFAKPGQDVYRFAFSIMRCLDACEKERPGFSEKLNYLFPEVKQFCMDGLQADPSTRPRLSDFIPVLENSLLNNEKRLQEAALAEPTFAGSVSSLWHHHAGKMTVTAIAAMSSAMLWRMQTSRK